VVPTLIDTCLTHFCQGHVKAFAVQVLLDNALTYLGLPAHCQTWQKGGHLVASWLADWLATEMPGADEPWRDRGKEKYESVGHIATYVETIAAESPRL